MKRRKLSLALLILLGVAGTGASPSFAQGLGPGLQRGPIRLPVPKGTTVAQARGCRYAQCSPTDRSCIEMNGRGRYLKCPRIVRRPSRP